MLPGAVHDVNPYFETKPPFFYGEKQNHSTYIVGQMSTSKGIQGGPKVTSDISIKGPITPGLRG